MSRLVKAESRPIDLHIDGLGSGYLIGRGASARVYRSERKTHGDDVAVKIMERLVSEQDQAMFERELRALEVLKEVPHIVGALDFGTTRNNEAYLLLPLFKAGSLQDVLHDRESFDWQEAVEVVTVAARAVQGAHDLGILHRDIKPANLLLSQTGSVYVSDFGISKVLENSTTPTQSGFTIGYAPPEAFDSKQTKRSDVYSLGATLAALVTGATPFHTGDADEDRFTRVLYRVINDPPPDLTTVGCPPEIAAVVEQAMSKDEADRPQTAGEFARLLQRAKAIHLGQELAESAVVTGTDGVPKTVISDFEVDKPPDVTAPPREPSPFHKVPIAIGLLLLAGIAAVVGLTQWGPLGDSPTTEDAADSDSNIEAEEPAESTADPTAAPTPVPTTAPVEATRVQVPARVHCAVGTIAGDDCIVAAELGERARSCEEAGLDAGANGCVSVTPPVLVCPAGSTSNTSGQCERQPPPGQGAGLCPAGFQPTNDGQNCAMPSLTVSAGPTTGKACEQGVLSIDNNFCIVPRSPAPTVSIVAPVFRCQAGTLDGDQCTEPADPGVVTELQCDAGSLMDDGETCLLGPVTRVGSAVFYLCPPGSVPTPTQETVCLVDERAGDFAVQVGDLVAINGTTMLEELNERTSASEPGTTNDGCWFAAIRLDAASSIYCVRSPATGRAVVDLIPVTFAVVDDGLVRVTARSNDERVDVGVPAPVLFWGPEGPFDPVQVGA